MVAFLERPRSAPFCLYFSHKAVHPNVQQRNDGSIVGAGDTAEHFVPAPRHRDLYPGAKDTTDPIKGTKI